MMRRALPSFVLLLCLALPALGGDPNMKRGIAPGSTYSAFDIDTINEFNGNLVIRIPLSDLPAGPLLHQVLMLSYNSRIYDYEWVQEDQSFRRRAVPEKYSNAGLGWIVSLGKVEPPRAPSVGGFDSGHGWIYRSPDGAEHEFGNSNAPDPTQAITTDGTFLRITRTPSDPSQALQFWDIEFRDGSARRFNSSGDLTQITDGLGHAIEIDYSDPMKWTIRQKFGATIMRTTTINFLNRTAPVGYAYEPNFLKVIDSIQTPAYDGRTATYAFTYEDAVFTRGGDGDYDADHPHFAAPWLKQVDLPEGLSYAFDPPQPFGQVRKVTLPTKGSIEWSPVPYRMTLAQCDIDKGWEAIFEGVGKRTVRDAAGATIGEWTYANDIDLAPSGSGECLPNSPLPCIQCGPDHTHKEPWGLPPTEITTTVTSNLTGDGKTVHYFSGVLDSTRANQLNYKVEEYGLPLTRRVPHATVANRFLSTERFDAEDKLLRSTYTNYTVGLPDQTTGVGAPRVQGSLTVFNDDTGCGNAACYVDTDHPEIDYAGYGLYKKTVTTSNFGQTRTEFTNFTPNSTSWLLNTYDYATVEENGVTRKETFTFDGNGFMTSRRMLIGTGPSSKDLLQAICRNSRGYLSSERFFGGDGQLASVPSNPCESTPAENEYQIDHSYTFYPTTEAPKTHKAKYSGMAFLIADEDFDANTGLVSKTRDVSEVETSFGYDLLGRLVSVKPSGLPWTQYQYAVPTVSTKPSVQVTTWPYGSSAGGTPQSEAWEYYDATGRLIQTKRRIPSDTGLRWSTANVVYDALGRATSQSVPEFRDSSAYESSFSPAKSASTTYDVFGRPLVITGADDKTTTVSYTGSGVREISTTRQIALETGLTDVTTWETYDAYGLLTDVLEPIGARTHHSYDSAGHLTKVCQNTTDGVFCGQSRAFTFDNRGFLQSEDHPENDKINYTYDARGHALTKTIDGDTTSDRNLKFIYDSAERLLQAQTYNAADGDYRAGKVFAFASVNSDPNKALGKLESATRFNYGTETIVVKETYSYNDAAGRLTDTTTEIKRDGVVLQTLSGGQSYDDVNSVFTLNYPTCITVSCGSAAWNSTAFTFGNGFLKSVNRFANSITYNASGAVSQVTHSSPVVDTYTPDDTGVRPKSIQFSTYSSCGPLFILSGPENASVPFNSTATLTVSTNGADGCQWFEGDGTRIPGQTSNTYVTPAINGTKTYYVEIYNDCRTLKSGLVTVSNCTPPSIPPTSPPDASIAPEQTATLSVPAGATSYQWYEENGTPIAGATSSSFTTPSLTATKRYYVKASNGGCTATSRTSTVTVRPLLAPTGLTATASGASSVSISWNASNDAHHYVLERKSGGGFVQIQGNVNGTSTTDSAVVANQTYVYQVRAASLTGGVSSSPSNADLATTVVFTPLIVDPPDPATASVISVAHLNELLTAVNAIRGAYGASALAWTGILGATPAPSADGDVYAQHILVLRTKLNDARNNLGFGAVSYAEPSLTDFDIRAVHLIEIRGGVQ